MLIFNQCTGIEKMAVSVLELLHRNEVVYFPNMQIFHLLC